MVVQVARQAAPGALRGEPLPALQQAVGQLLLAQPPVEGVCEQTTGRHRRGVAFTMMRASPKSAPPESSSLIAQVPVSAVNSQVYVYSLPGTGLDTPQARDTMEPGSSPTFAAPPEHSVTPAPLIDW